MLILELLYLPTSAVPQKTGIFRKGGRVGFGILKS